MKMNEAFKAFREEMGLTASEMAELLGISYDRVACIEDGTEPLSQSMHELFTDRVGIGLECYRWCKVGDPEKLPQSVMEHSKVLTADWQRRIDEIVESTKKNLF